MKRSTFMIVAILLSLTTSAALFGAKKIVVKTIPENATIYVDGQAVGEGAYTVKFEKDNEVYVVTAVASGYIGRRYRLLKSNPNKSVLIRLPVDEAMAASVGSENGSELANVWMDITCRRGLSEDQVWKRLMSIATSYFDNIDVRDKAAGWIKTHWKITPFANQAVRTRLEVRMSFTGDDIITYRARIISEIKELDCTGPNCWESYDRVLKKYETMIEELQTSVGGGE